MADDIDLPVFPFRINWRNGMSERLSWKTDVLAGLTGNEQRRGLRLTPRREFEVTLTLKETERSFFDLWLHRMLNVEMMLPLWHDSVRTSGRAATGDSEVLVDTRGLEFRDGSLGLLRGLTVFETEVVQIETVEDNKLLLSSPITGAWPRGTRIEPLVRGRMTDQTSLKNVTSAVAEGQAVFELVGPQPYGEGVWTGDSYQGMPILTEGPNRSESLDTAYQWSFAESDSETGARYRKSDVGRAMVNQKHSWLLRGRVRKKAFREFLYQMQGQLKPCWLPTFNDDFQPAADLTEIASIFVRETGFKYTGGPSSGREYIQVVTNTARFYRKIIGTANAPFGQERLLLDAPFPYSVQQKNIRRISFMDTARFQNDQMEWNHINAADGVSTVAGVMQTFRNDRVPPAILAHPIPAAAMGDGNCGDAALDDKCKVVKCPEMLRLTSITDVGPPALENGWNLGGPINTPNYSSWNYYPNDPNQPDTFYYQNPRLEPGGTQGRGSRINSAWGFNSNEINDPDLDPRLQGQVLIEGKFAPYFRDIKWMFYVPGGNYTLETQMSYFLEHESGITVQMCREVQCGPHECCCDMTNVLPMGSTVIPLWPKGFNWTF